MSSFQDLYCLCFRIQGRYGCHWGNLHGASTEILHESIVADDEYINQMELRHVWTLGRIVKVFTDKGNVYIGYPEEGYDLVSLGERLEYFTGMSTVVEGYSRITGFYLYFSGC